MPVFSVIRDIGDIDEDEMYRTFNMGIGLVIIIPKEEENKTKELITSFRIGEIIVDDINKPKVVFK